MRSTFLLVSFNCLLLAACSEGATDSTDSSQTTTAPGSGGAAGGVSVMSGGAGAGSAGEAASPSAGAAAMPGGGMGPETLPVPGTGGAAPNMSGGAPSAGGDTGGGMPGTGGIANAAGMPNTDEIMAGMPAVGGMPAEIGAPPEATGPFAKREGPFKVLVYSGTAGFRHGSIKQGREMLTMLGPKLGFEPTFVGEKPVKAEDNRFFNEAELEQFELVFMLNPTGDALGSEHEAALEAWFKKGGAMVGTHSAADFEKDWKFYKELTMQYYEGHSKGGTTGTIVFNAEAKNHPALVGLPDPWVRSEEWYRFNSFPEWAAAGATPGLQVLGRTESQIENKGPSKGQPMIWAREWDGYRAFYTGLGHAGSVYEDPEFIKHITGGIMWAVRREHLIK